MVTTVFPKKCPECDHKFDANLEFQRCSEGVSLLGNHVGGCRAILCPKCGSHVDPPKCANPAFSRESKAGG